MQSAIKTAQLLKTIKQQEEQIDAKSYKNEFLGKFLNRLMSEIGERSFSMEGNSLGFEEFREEISPDKKELYNRYLNNNIKNALGRLNEMIKSLEIEDEKITVKVLTNTLNKLFESVFCVKDIKLNIKNEINNEYQVLECNAKVLIYILVDIIEYLIAKEEKQINLLIIKEENAITLKICNNIEDNELIEKIRKLVKLNIQINIEKEFEQVNVIIG